MVLRLRDGVSWCLCAERAVFLDLKRDRFFCLPPDWDAAFRSWAKGGESGVSALEPLRSCGLLVPDGGDGQPPRPAKLIAANHDLAVDQRGKAGLGDIVTAVLAQHRASKRLRHLSLQTILASRGAPRTMSAGDAIEVARRLAGAFSAAGLVLRTADRCLPRAIAMRDQCHRAGIAPALVFGVRLHPFAAHCWVQLDDAVLVGNLEQVRLFIPILAVP